MAQVTVKLKNEEKDALQQLAERERRDPRDQAALIVVRELERAGLLATKANTAGSGSNDRNA
jgi:hypothetical protein